MFQKILPVLLLNFVNILSFSLLIPILPSIVESYRGNEVIYGIILSSFSFFQFFAAPIFGSLSDHYGRRPVLILSQAGTLLSWVIFGAAFFIPNTSLDLAAIPLLVIFISRIIDGITGGNTTVANAYITDIVKPEEKTKAFGLFGATLGFGFILGPALGGLSYNTSIGFAGTALLAIVISTITLLMIIFRLPESLPPEKRSKKISTRFWHEINLFRRIKKFALTKELKKLFILRAFFAICFTAYTSIVILFLRDTYDLLEIGIGLIMTIIGFYSVINQGFLVPRISRKLQEIKTYYLGYILLFMILPILIIPMPLIAFLIFSYLISLAIDLCMPTFKTIISNYVTDEQQGEALGIDEALSSIGRMISPILITLIYSRIYEVSFLLISFVLFGAFISVGVVGRIQRVKELKN